MRKVIVLLLVSLFFLVPIQRSSSKTLSNHIIAGFGPVPGDLFAPYAIEIVKNQLMVLDQFGISIFNTGNKSFVKRFSIDVFKPASINWLDVFKSTSIIDFTASFLQGKPRNPELLYDSELHTSFESDSKGFLYIGSDTRILVVDPVTEKAIRTIALEDGYFYSFQISKEKIYLLKTKVVDFPANIIYSLVKMDLTGKVLSEVVLNKDEGTALNIGEFAVLPDLDMVVLTDQQVHDNDVIEFFFFDSTGTRIPMINHIDLSRSHGGLSGRTISYQAPNFLLVDCYESDPNTLERNSHIATLRYEKVGNEIFIVLESKKNFGYLYNPLSDFACNEDLMIGLHRQFSIGWDFQILCYQGNQMTAIGKSLMERGKILSSIAFGINKEGALIQSNLYGFGLINQFNRMGRYTTSYDNVGVFIRDLDIDENQQLICTNFFDGSIHASKFGQSGFYELIDLDKYLSSKKDHILANIIADGGKIYVLDSAQNNKGCPYLMEFDNNLDGEKNLKTISFKKTPPKEANKTPFFNGLAVSSREYFFLDCVNQEIWVYQRESAEFVEKIPLPKTEKSFYSSFALYPDGSLLLTDTIQCNLLHLSRMGEILETIGEKGEIIFCKSKEDYVKNPNQFFVPFRAKIKNNNIYVSDLFNCRYHIIPLSDSTKPDLLPEIIWEPETIKIDQFSIFEDQGFEVKFRTTYPKEISFHLNVGNSFIKCDQTAGKVSAQKISFIVMSNRLRPWETNKAYLHFTFPDYPDLDCDIEVSVNAKGNTVEMKIGSDKAKVNGKEMTINSPLLKKEEVFVVSQFISEIIFANRMKITYDQNLKIMLLEVRDKRIELYIDKNKARVNNVWIKVNAPPFIQEDRVYVPLQFICNHFDANVFYDAKTQTITIQYPGK
jgi:hypothetical protein